MTNQFFEQGILLRMLETLKMQMQSVEYTWNLYAHNAQLMAITTHSLSVELYIFRQLEAWRKGECENPFRGVDIPYWKNFFTGFDVDVFWMCDDEEEPCYPIPTDFDIFSTLIVHHVAKDKEECRDFYNLKEDGMRRDNANALEFALSYLANMSPSYAAEVAEDAIYHLEVTLEFLLDYMAEKNPEKVDSLIKERMKVGRKALPCFLPSVPMDELKRAFARFYEGISTDGGRVRLGSQEFDRKYVFVLLAYRFIRAGLMLQKLNVTCYTTFIYSALGLTEKLPSFRKSMNNWMQKIDLYGCPFEDLTEEMIRTKRFHEQQLTSDEWKVWCLVDKELEKTIADSGAFIGFL